ncbi:MAG TPA: sugar ABC transporter substrate-binding protein [Rectinemataceae bacterium]|nr:sugar ABC transporter substrate-binding protein [Rectinemataceae bacterium]
MTRRIAVVMALALLVVLVPSGLAAQGTQKTTLSVLWFNDSNESDVFQKVMADYLASHPNITLDLQVLPFTDYQNKLKLMIAGGNPPDVARVTNNHIAMFVDQLQPLTGKVFTDLAKNFYPSSLALGSDASGQLLAMPTEATANGMIVNKTYFKNAGIDVDKLSRTWTWDQWVDAMKKVLKANPTCKYGIAVDFTPNRWSTFLFEAGGRFLTNDGKKMAFNSPQSLDALNFFKMLHDTGLAPSSVWMGSENPQEMFTAGLVACHVGGSWLINAYNSTVKTFDWGAVRMPRRTINSSVPGGKWIATFKASANKQAAMDLIAAFSDKAHNEAYCRDTFNLSARKDAAIVYPSHTNDFKVFAADLAVTPAYTADDWKSPGLNKIYTYIREQIVEGLLGHQTMAQTAANIDAQGNSFLQ